jgi:hypothetical protein
VTSSGPKNSDGIDSWYALEASGSDTVPTDGSVVALAWPSPSQDFLVFHFAPRILGKIVAKKTSGSTTWYTWKEVEPGDRDTDGHLFSDKPAQAVTGTEESGPALRNPLFELNKHANVPAGSVVEVFRYPVRVNTGADGGYLRERPEAVITETQHADSTVPQSTRQQIKWYGAAGGSFKLRITNSAGTVGVSNAINYSDNAAAIDAAIVASGVVTTVTISGSTVGHDFEVQFDDTYTHVPPVEVVDSTTMWSDTPYFFVYHVPALVKSTSTPAEIAGPITSTKIHAFKETGVTLGENGANQGLMLLAATLTQQGAVSTAAQKFSGNKSTVGTIASANDSSYDPATGGTATGAAGILASTYISFIDYSVGTGYSGRLDFLRGSVGSTADADNDAHFVINATSITNSNEITTLGLIKGGNATFAVSGTGTPQFAIYAGGTTYYYGQTGTLAGMTIKGGIITTLPADLAYTATTSGDWNGTAPTTIKDALDRCAALLKTLNGGTGP